MLTIVEKVICLQNVDVFSEIPTEQLSYLAAIAEEVTYSADDVIYKFEEPSDALYVVLSGKVRLHRNEEEIAVAEPDDAFGTWALFEDTPRVATATALDETRLLRIDRDDFLDILADHVQITENVLKTLVGRLRGLLERVGVDIAPKAGS
ncbi:MAG: cyclic nucleotide-binding domain-containing protein [Candidatus Latescibacterota bacterium]|nr:MAG: cyclic nucleotide-binding domain-containing protein [Candidatus Latescibacterota bacterium]